MSDETDEYEQYHDLINIENVPQLVPLPLSPEPTISSPGPPDHPESQLEDIPAAENSQNAADSSDEYDEYTFEFTDEEFTNIDAAVLSAIEADRQAAVLPASIHANAEAGSSNGWKGRNNASGPAVDICVEESTKTSRIVKASDMSPVPNDTSQKTQHPSPYERFRSYRGILSVTDLVGPSWCEVQYDYSLRGKRYLKLKDRPKSFITADGKQITPDLKVAAVNDEGTKRGKSVHKVLEREIHPEPVHVEVTTEEERWALRLVNMITSLQALFDGGRCREMPVFGVLNSQIVTGIIDEIERKPISISDPPLRTGKKRDPPGTPTKSESSNKKSRLSTPTVEQPTITSFFPSSTTVEPAEPNTEEVIAGSLVDLQNSSSAYPHFRLSLSDTKTRRHKSLPSHADTLGARLQLMFYHRLLSRLLVPPTQSEDALDFQALWMTLGLDHRRPFSADFRKQLGLRVDASPEIQGLQQGGLSTVTCLNDLTKIWRNIVESLNIDGVDDTLTIMYRTQPEVKRRKRKGKKIKQEAAILKDEEEDIIRAVLDSLKYGPSIDDAELMEAISDSWRSLAADAMVDIDQGVTSLDDPDVIDMEADRAYGETANQTEEDIERAWVIQQALLAHVRTHTDLKKSVMPQSDSEGLAPFSMEANGKTEEEGKADTSDSDIDVGQQDASTIIGTKTFRMNDRILDEYLKNVLDWWHGKRQPKGVDIELTRRCLWCEYQEGCEWREKKAAEAQAKLLSPR